MKNRLPQYFRVDNVLTFMEDNCVTLTGELLNLVFLTVFERNKIARLRKETKEQKAILFAMVESFTKQYFLC